ncbi:MAG: F0F1 ATP synthase subunit A [Fimbriimonadaceae bacterium]
MDLTSALSSLLPNSLAAATEDIGWNIFVYVGAVLLTIFVFFGLARRGVTDRVFKGLIAQSIEHVVLFIENICLNVIGPHGRKYAPLLVAFWSYIIVSNTLGLVFNFTPTAEWSLNLSLAFISIVFVQWEGIRANGPFGHLKHFAGPKMAGALVLVSGLLFIIEITSEVMKLASLSLRLYGNIHGGHEVVTNLNQMVAIPVAGHTYYVPLGGLLLPLKLLSAILQAYIFVILTATYLSLVTAHGHDEEEHASSAGPAHGVAAAA